MKPVLLVALVGLLGVAPSALPAVARADAALSQRSAAVRERLLFAPLDPALRAEHARLLRLGGQPQEALESLDGVAGGAPALERARAHLAVGEPEVARSQLDRALDDPGLGPLDRAAALTLRAELRPPADPAALGELDEAADLHLTPQRALLRAARAEALADADGAEARLRADLVALRGAVVVRIALVELLLRHRPAAAVPEADALLALRPDHVPWLLLRARAFPPEQARPQLERALSLADAALASRPTGLEHAARAAVRLALGDVAGAREDAARAGPAGRSLLARLQPPPPAAP